jgi:hypothetical protein
MCGQTIKIDNVTLPHASIVAPSDSLLEVGNRLLNGPVYLSDSLLIFLHNNPDVVYLPRGYEVDVVEISGDIAFVKVPEYSDPGRMYLIYKRCLPAE